jgi:hypothetical protein
MTNSTFQNMVGYKDEELKELTPLDITPDGAQRETNRIFLESYSKESVIISNRLNSCSERTAS